MVWSEKFPTKNYGTVLGFVHVSMLLELCLDQGVFPKNAPPSYYIF